MAAEIELLAPAGGPEALVAAVQNGADAVYLGAGGFNARQTADNFRDWDALRQAVRYCHIRGVKVYVTLNTMVREDEQAALEETIAGIALSGADAVLVQDFGVARRVRQMVPDLALHASTQMAAHSAQAVAFLAGQGFRRVVLAREMSLRDIAACRGLGVELEVFAHGALCVACSGQCLFSSMVGGRSGNRGRCAQPCRMHYSMDGEEGCLLSPRDLCALDDIPALIEAGASSLKLEGRLKRPEYVSAVTDVYRRAIDRASRPDDRAVLRQMFNRGGFTTGYLHGLRDSELMFRWRPNHLGVEVGSCDRAGTVRLREDVRMSDALALRGSLREEDRPVKLEGRAGERVRCPEARAGDALVRLVSEALMEEQRARTGAENRVVPIKGRLTLRVGSPAALKVTDGTRAVSAEGGVVEPARQRGLDPAVAQAQMEKTGGTPYRFDEIQIDADAQAFAPLSGLNRLRREALDRLSDLRAGAPHAVRPAPSEPLEPHAWPECPEIVVQSGDCAALRRALELGADRAAYLPGDLRPEALAEAEDKLPEHFSLVLPPVLTDRAGATLYSWAQRLSGRIEVTYLSNIGQFGLDWPGRRIADYTLNAANLAACRQLMEWGCSAITPSIELNVAQIRPLTVPRELLVHGRIPLMHLRHCPIRAVGELPGKHADCRRCDHCAPEEAVSARRLIDRKGAAFPLRRVASEDGCVVQVLNSAPLMLLRRGQKLPPADAWRLWLEDAQQVETYLPLYRALAEGRDVRGLDGWANVETETTTGHYFRGVE